MKLTTHFSILTIIVALTGCGGGGGGGGSSAAEPVSPPVVTNPTTPPVLPPVTPPVTTPVAVNSIDPYTNAPAVGVQAQTISGVAFNTVGATVTAYAMQPDGTNGAVVGTSGITDTQGSFSIVLSNATSGMLRLVSVGGITTSKVDGSKVSNSSLELVLPFATSETSKPVITPVTHMISHLVSYKAKGGATLGNAFISATNVILSLSAPNLVLAGSTRPGISLLSTIPGSDSDLNNTYLDVLNSFEWFGVRYDLPSSTVSRILAANAENEFPLRGVDGSGAAINVGNWAQGKFDETIPMSLDEVTAQRNSDGSLIYAADGTIIHEYVKTAIATNYIQYFYRTEACRNLSAENALFTRYPNDAGLFANATLKASVCAHDIALIENLKSRILINNRSKVAL